ncbi:ATP-grasp domain-containing protein [Actinopolyspora mortivallis]|uniref:ATP-grasp domain-containing protein n=1 Tax=Actinopolyspora mortivallis TaxID=33906 RepID=UPI00036AFCD0|nr:ATP-grasp domain-containing protein [Actinopolyspora mortivallis]
MEEKKEISDEEAPAVLFLGDLVVLSRQGGLFRETRRRGMVPVVVVSNNTDIDRLTELREDPTHPLSTLGEVVRVPDAQVSTVLPLVQPLLQRYTVRGVMSVGEPFVEAAGVLADCLGLPGAGSRASLICRNKLMQRMTVPQYSPRSRAVPVEERKDFTLPADEYPAVVKPAGRFYSLGVREVHDQRQLTAALDELRSDEISLVESRVEGPELSVESLVQHGEIVWSGITAKETNESGGNFFTEIGHTSPADLDPESEQALLRVNEETVRAIGVRDGMTHGEYRLAKRGPVLMEMAARLPGDAITFLWELATGRSLEPVLLDLALGETIEYPRPRRRARQYFTEHPHGVLRDVTAGENDVYWVARDDRWPRFEPVDAEDPTGVRAVLVGRAPGVVLGDQTDSGQRSVSVVFDAPLDEDVEKATKESIDNIEILVDPV